MSKAEPISLKTLAAAYNIDRRTLSKRVRAIFPDKKGRIRLLYPNEVQEIEKELGAFNLA